MSSSIVSRCFANAFTLAAKRVMENIQKIEENPKELSKRIFWELLQNATDALPEDSSLDFKIDYNSAEGLLAVSHNGRDFTLEEVANLCIPDSSKEENESAVGTYGTGFLSTHALSSNIEVSGAFTDQGKRYSFNLSLNRSDYSQKKVLAEKMRQSAESLDETKKEISHGELVRTTFTYDLKQQLNSLKSTRSLDAVAEIVKQNLIDFRSCLPYAVLFRGKSVKRIQTIQDGKTSTFTFSQDASKFFMHCDGEEVARIFYTSHASTRFALPLTRDDKIQNMDSVPKLFCYFPLVGTESIFCPVVVHHPQFTPKEKRNDISETMNSILWRNLVMPGMEGCLNSVSDLSQTYHLLPTGNQNKSHWTFDSVLNIMKRVSIVPTTANRFESLSTIKLPDSQELYDLAPSNVVMPKRDEYQEWKDRCAPFLRPYTVRRYGYMYRNRNSNLEFVHQFTTNDLVNAIRSIHENDFSKYKNALRYIFQSRSFSDSEIILCESGHLKSLEDSLHMIREEPKWEELVTILESITGVDKKQTLLHSSLHDLRDELSVWKRYIPRTSIRSWCEELDDYLRRKWSSIESKLNSQHSVKQAFSKLLGYLKDDEIKGRMRFTVSKQVPIMNALFPAEKQDAVLSLMQDSKMLSLVSKVKDSPHREVLEQIINNSELLEAMGTMSPQDLKNFLQSKTLLAANGANMSAEDVRQMLDQTASGENNEGNGFGVASNPLSSFTGSLREVLQSPQQTAFTKKVGDAGEKLVYDDLCKCYGTQNVTWSAQQREGRFDIEVKDGDRTLFVEVKSTTASSSEATQMCIHASQWRHMKRVSSEASFKKDEFWLARCFNVMKSNASIDYVQLIEKTVE